MDLLRLRRAYLDQVWENPGLATDLADSFERKLVTLISSEPTSFHHPFDSLKKELTITTSPDGRLRIFAWEPQIGGTWHEFHSYAQFETSSGIAVQALVSEKEVMEGELTDADYYRIQLLQSDGVTRYLVTGWGTHGSGNHHMLIRSFQLKNDALLEDSALFGGERYLGIQAQRSYRIQLEFDPKRRQIRHNAFAVDDSGFYESTGKYIKWRWKSGVFEARRPKRLWRKAGLEYKLPKKKGE